MHYDQKDSAAIAKAMGGFESNDPALRDMVGQKHARPSPWVASRAWRLGGMVGAAPPDLVETFQVYIIPSDEPNAFAAGTKASVVAVTTGLLDLLTPRELRAVLAHEIGHVRNRDMARSLFSGCMVAGLGFAMTIGDMLIQSDRRDRRRKKSKDDKGDGGRSARAHLVRLRGDHASDGYYPQNDALTIGGVRRRRVRQEHRRGTRPRVGAGETGGVPRDGENETRSPSASRRTPSRRRTSTTPLST